MGEFPNILSIVLAVFLSPSLPEGVIEVGKTPCEEAKAILQQYQMRLVDTEYLPQPDIRATLITAPQARLEAVHTLSFERTGTEFAVGGGAKSSFLRKKAPPRAGFILCGLFTMGDALMKNSP